MSDSVSAVVSSNPVMSCGKFVTDLDTGASVGAALTRVAVVVADVTGDDIGAELVEAVAGAGVGVRVPETAGALVGALMINATESHWRFRRSSFWN